MATTDDERRVRAPRDARVAEPGFPPMIDYPALDGLPLPVRFAVATAALPFEIGVTSVRLLKDVEALLAEITVHLRSLRPAVAAMGEAYAGDRLGPLLDTVEDLRTDTRAVAVVWAPFTAVRDVLTPTRARTEPAVVAELPPAVPPSPPPSTIERLTRLLWPPAPDRDRDRDVRAQTRP